MKLLESMLEPSCSPSPVKRDKSCMAQDQDSVLAPHCFAVETNVLSHCQAGSSSLVTDMRIASSIQQSNSLYLSLLIVAPSGVLHCEIPARKASEHNHLFQAILTELWPSVMVSPFRWIPVCFMDHIGNIRFHQSPVTVFWRKFRSSSAVQMSSPLILMQSWQCCFSLIPHFLELAYVCVHLWCQVGF
jgi:hypothetical protein